MKNQRFRYSVPFMCDLFLGVVMRRYKSLAEERPNLLKEWDYEENDKLGIRPDNVTFSSAKKAWWKCSKCGHKWQSTISNRSNGRGCPVCSGREL